MAKILLNPYETLNALKAQLNTEMTAAAEPVIQSALAEIERAMRARLASATEAITRPSYFAHLFSTQEPKP